MIFSHVQALEPYFDYHAQFSDIKEGEIYGKMKQFYQNVLPNDIAER